MVFAELCHHLSQMIVEPYCDNKDRLQLLLRKSFANAFQMDTKSKNNPEKSKTAFQNELQPHPHNKEVTEDEDHKERIFTS